MSKKLAYLRIFGYVTTIVLHVANIFCMAYHLDQIKDSEALSDPLVQLFIAMQYRFYTCWNFFMQIVYAILALTCDVLILMNNRCYELPKQLKKSRDCIFSAIVWPCTFIVFTVFWGLYHIDRDLVLPPVLDIALTPLSNHVIHTAIVPIVLWELMFQPRYPPKSHMLNAIHIVFHHIVYLSVFFYTYYEHGKFLYPIFDKVSGTIYFPLLLLFIVFIAIVFYYIHWALARFLWGDRITPIDPTLGETEREKID